MNKNERGGNGFDRKYHRKLFDDYRKEWSVNRERVK